MDRIEIIASIRKLANEYGCSGTKAGDLIADAFNRLADIIENAECAD